MRPPCDIVTLSRPCYPFEVIAMSAKVISSFVRRSGTLGFPILLAMSVVSNASASSTNKDTSELWSLRPIVQPPVPANVTQSTNPIDAFIVSEYKARSLKAAGPAEKSVLLRRVYLDLIGIPPSPAELDAFSRDSSPDAYERVVDRLLASDQHAVRYARHWLDVLR